MTEAQRQLLAKATESVAAARLLLKDGFTGFAASRAYYAMFYVAQALLQQEGLSFAKHSGTIAAFGQYLAKTGKVPKEYHRMLIDAQDLREVGDYGLSQSVAPADVQELISNGEKFLRFAEECLKPPA